MKIDHSSFSKVTAAITLYTLAVGSTFFVVPEAKAADAYEECRQILTQDIFNRVIKGDSSKSFSEAQALATFFQSTDTEAYEQYKKDFAEAKKKGTRINAEGHYAFIGGQLGIDLTSENQVSESEFKEKFNRAKTTYQSSTSSSSSSSQDLVSNYASYVRDPQTVNAWKDCVTKTKEPGIYAFAGRDKAKRIYVNVMWVPGSLVGFAQSIPISFATEDEAGDIKIYPAKPEERRVAMGSGKNFVVSCGKECDDGFEVRINGTVKDKAGNEINDYAATVEVPPLNPPQPQNKVSSTDPDTCKQGYVWRGATPNDRVCVDPATQQQVLNDNQQASSRVQPGGGPYGPNTCKQGYVWREATPDDLVCVYPPIREQARNDNKQAANRRQGSP